MAKDPASTGGVFISYRRQDSGPYALLLREELRNHLDGRRVFMDVDSIPIGHDFVDAVREALDGCAVLIALVGPGWLAATDSRGRSRLADPDDTVRLEIEAAFDRKLAVIPILIDGTGMPERRVLPDSLAALTRRNALNLTYDRYEYEISRLLEAIDRALVETPPKLQSVGRETKAAAPAARPSPVRPADRVVSAAARPRQAARPAVSSRKASGGWVGVTDSLGLVVIAVAALMIAIEMSSSGDDLGGVPASYLVAVAAAAAAGMLRISRDREARFPVLLHAVAAAFVGVQVSDSGYADSTQSLVSLGVLALLAGVAFVCAARFRKNASARVTRFGDAVVGWAMALTASARAIGTSDNFNTAWLVTVAVVFAVLLSAVRVRTPGDRHTGIPLSVGVAATAIGYLWIWKYV